jgi:transposase
VAGSSLKAALDHDWDDPSARTTAVGTVLDLLEAVTAALRRAHMLAVPPVAAALAIAEQVRDQDVVTGENGQPQLRRGVAPDRRISVEDGAMRHGRKSRAQRVDGYKRHVLHDLDQGLIRAVGITPANVPEAQVTDAVWADLAQQQASVRELHIDRAYLSSTVVRDRPADLTILCKAWPVRNGARFPKTAFQLDWERGQLRCPNGAEVPFAVGQTVHFPTATCAACPLRTQCTSSASGRSVAIHPDERLLVELRERQTTAAGRGQLRERVAVEHTLAHIGHWQGRRARYRGERKNVFDLRRVAVVHNLHVLQRAA